MHEDRLQLAQLLALRGAADEAEALYRDVLSRVDRTAEDHAARNTAGNGLASLLLARGDLAGAERLLREAHEERLAVYGTRHVATARSAAALGGVLLRADRLDDAEAAFRMAAEAYAASVGERHLGYANALAQMADIESRRGRHAVADSLIAAGIRLRIAGEGPTAHGLADLLRRRAEVAIAAGRYPAAETFLAEALGNAAARSYSPGVSQEIHDTYARLYHAWGRPADAARHAAQGRRPPGPVR